MGRKTTYSRENVHAHIFDTEKMRMRISPNGYGKLIADHSRYLKIRRKEQYRIRRQANNN